MNYLVILVGGTGQAIGHFWLQMSLLGLTIRDARILTIDTDGPWASLRFMSESLRPLLVEALTRAETNKLFPEIHFLQARPEASGNEIMHILTAQPAPSRTEFQHEVQAFFSLDTLRQPANRGLFGRPALSAVVALDNALQSISETDLQDNTRVVVVSSCIGGTGAGLTIPLLYRLQGLARSRHNISLRLVLLGEHFIPTAGTVGEDRLRFTSNKTLFLKTLSESISDLHSYSFVEKEPVPERNQQQEQEARHLPWAEASQPYWKGVCALQEQLTDSTRAKQPNFAAKEVPERVYQNAINREKAMTRLDQALARANAMLEQRMIVAIEQEVFPALQWGRRLAGLLRHQYHRVLLAHNRDARVLNDIAGQVQEAMQNLWMPGTDGYGLGLLFPQIQYRKATSAQMRGVRWPAPPAGAGVGMNDVGHAASVIAANLLLGAVGFGG